MNKITALEKTGKINLSLKEEPSSLNEIVSLKGRKTLISGAASGIGRAIAIRFAEAGSDLILVDIDKKGLDEVKEKTQLNGNAVLALCSDLSGKDAVRDLWETISPDVPDTIVNNAGIYPFKDYLQIDRNFYENTLEVNLNSVFWMCQNFIRKRGSRGGIIINISSIEALIPFKEDMAHYSVSKAGVMALTRSLARDYGRKGFRVNCVLPGAIRTPGTESLVKKAITKLQLNLIRAGINFNSRLTLGRWGKPDEVAKVVLFIASDMASYVQGTMIPVDGGFLSC
ncbi:MAG: SDR family oxidoreductase [Actinobacteria bacterium]|nr:SDR family oxidoreductase [Actinomycetota bacterium]